MSHSEARNFEITQSERSSRPRRTQRDQRVLGVLLWLGLVLTLLHFAGR